MPWSGCGPITPCPGVSGILPEQGEGVATPENLATLKAQLQQALAQVEAQERVMEEGQKPQTVEETEVLEQKLAEALEELRAHKDELRRRSSEGG
jgi:acyl-CoA thioesterase